MLSVGYLSLVISLGNGKSASLSGTYSAKIIYKSLIFNCQVGVALITKSRRRILKMMDCPDQNPLASEKTLYLQVPSRKLRYMWRT